VIVDTRGARLYPRCLFIAEASAGISRPHPHSPPPGSAQL